jgi:phosphatidylserine/phosphatidylglycerophosphate/cardiolipin synthase-like enzyme/uncharacterized membrane protein YdjX (TVP38/TMEM64 family)
VQRYRVAGAEEVEVRGGETGQASVSEQEAAFPLSRRVDSLLRPGENCCAVAHSARAAFLVDAQAYFLAFRKAAADAERSILILAWDFDSRTQLDEDAGGRGTTIGTFLNELVRRRRRLHVHILDWDFPMIFGRDREFPPLYGLDWRPHRRVRLRYDDTHPLAGSHHQKIVVIDDRVAFVGGLDLTLRRWDTPAHRSDDPRRVALGKPYPPFHDTMVMVDGHAARVLGDIARNRWRIATGEQLEPPVRAQDPWPPDVVPDVFDVRVGIACTAPGVNGHAGTRDVEQLYLDMIAASRRYIFMENQYFTSRALGDALVARLGAARGPEIVLVTRLLSHGWLEEVTMHTLRARLIERLRAADHAGRFHVYYPHIDGLAEGTCIDVHSKLMIVDDEWLRIGSANISNRSMGVDTECDVVVEALGQREISRAIRRFRDHLFAEHLGVAPERFAEEYPRTGSMACAVSALRVPRRTLLPLDGASVSDGAVSAAAIADLEQPVTLDRLVEELAPEEKEKTASSGHRWAMVAAVVVGVAGLTALWRFTPLAERVTPERIIEWSEAFAGAWWAPLAVVLAYTPAMVTMFPRPLITLAAVVAFGPWIGFGYAMSGVLLAAVLAYWGGRRVPRQTLRRLSGASFNRLAEALRQRGLMAVTAVRLVPLAPFVVEGLVAGAIRIPLWQYVVGTFLGMLPGMLTATVFGDQIETALHDPSQINYGIVAAVVVGLLVVTLVVRRWLASLQHGSQR